jgi:hypothetical protein
MTTRATINQVTQLGVETTPGTAVAANRRLTGLQIGLNVRANTQAYRPTGGKFSTIVVEGKEWAEGSVSGPLTYTEIVYLLAGVMNFSAPTQQGTSTAYLWDFSPPQSGNSTIRTYTIEHGDSIRAHRAAYGLFNAITITGTRDAIEVGGSLLARSIEDDISLTASPTAVALVPVLPIQVSGFVDNTASALGTTRLTRLLRWEFELGDRYAPVWPIDAQLAGNFPVHVETEPAGSLKLLVEANAQGMALLSSLRNGGKRFVRIEAIGGIADATYNYRFTLDVCGIVENVADFSDEDGVYAVEFSLRPVFDAGWNRALRVQVVNTLSAL